MSLTDREFWTVIHRMGLGALFLLAFASGLAGLWSLSATLILVALGILGTFPTFFDMFVG
jgi:hypothetical protein